MRKLSGGRMRFHKSLLMLLMFLIVLAPKSNAYAQSVDVSPTNDCGQVLAPCLTISAEALNLILVELDVEREKRAASEKAFEEVSGACDCPVAIYVVVGIAGGLLGALLLTK